MQLVGWFSSDDHREAVPLTPQEIDSAFARSIGMTWQEIVREHSGKCGACKDGTLRLETVTFEHVSAWRASLLWNASQQRRVWDPPPPPPAAVTVQLKCTHCPMQLEMPLHAQEEATERTNETYDEPIE